jgi:hypothetical protein
MLSGEAQEMSMTLRIIKIDSPNQLAAHWQLMRLSPFPQASAPGISIKPHTHLRAYPFLHEITLAAWCGVIWCNSHAQPYFLCRSEARHIGCDETRL